MQSARESAIRLQPARRAAPAQRGAVIGGAWYALWETVMVTTTEVVMKLGLYFCNFDIEIR